MDAKIEAWNADPTHTHTLGHNQFSDWTPEERARLTASNIREESQIANKTYLKTDDLPDSVDWRSSGAVTPV